MSEHPGSRACYVRGCRALECRVANAVYEKLRRARRRQGPGVVNGRKTSRMLIGLRAEGYHATLLQQLAGLSRMTVWRHMRSWPARLSTYQRVKLLWDDIQGGARNKGSGPDLTTGQQKVVASMLNSLGRDWDTEAQTWQIIRPADEDV